MVETTISCIKADVGSLAGHVIVPEPMLEIMRKHLKKNALDKGIIDDFYVFNVGDDLETVMTHNRGANDEKIHELAWDGFVEAAEYAKKNKLYGAGQDLLADAFSGNVKGQGPGVAEMVFEERKSDPIVIFACDKTEPQAFNLPIYKIFADPFNTAGLTLDPTMIDGFIFEVYDLYEHTTIMLNTPEEIYELLALIGTTSKYAIKRVFKKGDSKPTQRIAAEICTEKLNVSAGKYVGKDDPVAIVRGQSGFPAVGEIMEGFTHAHIVSGWMRGSHKGPLLPVSVKDATPTRFDGPPRIVALGFQVGNRKLYGPRDMFSDISFDLVRKKALEIADILREQGPFEPHRVSEAELEYTTMPQVMEKLKGRFKKIEE